MSRTPQLSIRDVRDADLAGVHAINESSVPHVNSIDIERFRGFTREAAYFRVALVDDTLAGVLVAFAPGAGYESLNYRWFEARYRDFVYVDRIAVAESARRRGVARMLYEDLFRAVASRTRRITCEVNTRPANDGSMAFHERFGFRPVGSQQTENGAKTVCLMTLEPVPELR